MNRTLALLLAAGGAGAWSAGLLPGGKAEPAAAAEAAEPPPLTAE